MKKLFVIAGFVALAGCAQFTTNESERSALSEAASVNGDAYIACIKQESQRLLSVSSEAGFVVDTAKNACTSQLEAYKTAQTKYLKTQYIKTDVELEKSVEALNETSRLAITEMLVAAPAAASASTSSAVAAPVRQQAAIPVSGSYTPASDQRVYMDCMQDQAKKYVRLNETAAAIAEVAASRCKPHLVGTNLAALEQEGRALVMGSVFDARLEASP